MLPVNELLARDGTYALEVRSTPEAGGWWGVGLPVDRSWAPVDLGPSCSCTFEAFSDSDQCLSIKVKSGSGLYSPAAEVLARASCADWDPYSVTLDLPDGVGSAAEMLLLTGPANGGTVLLRAVLLTC